MRISVLGLICDGGDRWWSMLFHFVQGDRDAVLFCSFFGLIFSGLSVNKDSQPRSLISVAGDAEIRFFKSGWMR